MEDIKDERKEAANWSVSLVLIFNTRKSLSFFYVIICDCKIGEDNRRPHSNANYVFFMAEIKHITVKKKRSIFNRFDIFFEAVNIKLRYVFVHDSVDFGRYRRFGESIWFRNECRIRISK